MAHVQSILTKHVKLSSIDEAKLLRKRASLTDSLELTRSVAKDLEAQLATFGIVEVTGAVVILTALVSDIILDTAGETVGKEFPVAKRIFSYLYDQAKQDEWKGNRYEKEIKLIKENGGRLEQLAKKDPTGMWAMVVTVHKNMFMNAAGLMGHIEDSKESRLTLVKSIKSLRENIRILEEKLRECDYYLNTGEGDNSLQRSTSASPRLH